MYKQYRFQYSAPPKTTSPAKTPVEVTANNNTTDKTPVEVTDNNNTKTPVEVTADDVINAVKDWVTYDNVRKKEYDQLRDNGNWTNLNNNEEDHDKTRSIKKTQNFQQTTDLTRTTNWTTVKNMFTNKNTPVPKDSAYSAWENAMSKAYINLFTYFFEKKSTDEIFDKLFEKKYDSYLTRESAFVVLHYLRVKTQINVYMQKHIPHICLFLSDPEFRFNTTGSGNVDTPMKTDKKKKQALQKLLNRNNPSVENKMKHAILTIYYLDHLMDKPYYTKNTTKYYLRIELKREVMIFFNTCLTDFKRR